MVGVDKPATGQNPGVLFVNSKITKPDELSPEGYTKWYEKVHIPDIFKTSGIKEASRWEAIDPKSERPYLALYPLEDLNFLQTDEFKAIPVHDDSLPGSHAIFDFADFDTRYYKFVQHYEAENAKSGQADFVIAAGFTPTDEEDYDNWYRQEHLKEISGITGWRKTQRYALTFARQNRKPAGEKQLAEPPKFLTLHFFDGASLPEKELAGASGSEWTKKQLGSMKETQMAIFKKLSQYTK
ncbi:hypothetical protein LTR91_018424 [Friedmanniomyces endolithicus]|uniref:EthD domain-containing protein n=1 Tax=Friedmanniomyces endolithicus TaxID=329885 RepID=A0AAN6FNS3_9PEZI|nr:hypothetical protein LTR35_003289 [Friedmanniomyces endolithicus]KAK0293145.1 hypothetical protein LTS00_007747 [Friedmanniomyces endolithicus]KAK0319480.1 hypothetical protein LTR82_009546 [Friedmanniomyces endolithicus]KAK0930243.1 hypothetical protein LTR57_001412 [Friedmanniomyces endolithicus]KAK0964561.1 hypothetical protein LTR91_018424 [Friedmanniomyces endolithicus]